MTEKHLDKAITEITQAAIEYAMKSDCEKFVSTVRDVLCQTRKEALEEFYHKAKSWIPGQQKHDHSCEFDCKGCIDSGWNQGLRLMEKSLDSVFSHLANMNPNEEA